MHRVSSHILPYKGFNEVRGVAVALYVVAIWNCFSFVAYTYTVNVVSVQVSMNEQIL